MCFTMKQLKFLRKFLLIFVIFNGTLFAQQEITLDLFRPQLGVAGQTVPNKGFDEISGEFGFQSLSLYGILPLGPSSIRTSGFIRLLQFLVFAHATGLKPEITFIDSQHTFYSGDIALASLIVSNSKNIYWFSGGLGSAVDDQAIQDIAPRFWTLDFGTYRAGKSFMFIYGLTFAYTFGKGLFFPLLGMYWEPNYNWSVQTILPLSLKIDYRVNNSLTPFFLIGILGNNFQFSNNGEFENYPQLVSMKVVWSYLSLGLNYKVTSNFSLMARSGILGNRQFSLADGNTNFISSTIAPSGYLQIVVKYTFGKSLFEMR